jgi:ABC-type bacteriocin/lantibiotic exporter with double-glycine peptidase domain
MQVSPSNSIFLSKVPSQRIYKDLAKKVVTTVQTTKKFKSFRRELSELEKIESVKSHMAKMKTVMEELPSCSCILEFTVSFSIIKNEETKIIQNVHATVPSGTTLAILGPSGAGKSTLLNGNINIFV